MVFPFKSLFPTDFQRISYRQPRWMTPEGLSVLRTGLETTKPRRSWSVSEPSGRSVTSSATSGTAAEGLVVFFFVDIGVSWGIGIGI